MLTLGISDSHDASAVLIADGKILAAASEERFTRRKRQQGFPYHSLKYLQGLIPGKRVDRVYVAGRYGRAAFRLLDVFYSRTDPRKDILAFSSKLASIIENVIAGLPLIRNAESCLGRLGISFRLRKLGIGYKSLHLIEHHYAHLLSALTGIISSDYLAVSLDAYGDGRSGLIIRSKNDDTKKVIALSYSHSLAGFYAYICARMGFQEGEEGKVMALADYGRETELSRILTGLFKASPKGLEISRKYKTKAFLNMLAAHKKEDAALALQKTVEQVTVSLLRQLTDKTSHPDLLLSGGFFANIKVTQRLHETGLFGRVFVFPHMGDGGTCFASAVDPVLPKKYLSSARYLSQIKTARLEHAYLGPDYPDKQIKQALDKGGLYYTKEPAIEKRIACLLAQGKIIARFDGRMEYGPRALGNRSILCQATDKSVNSRLNSKLGRPGYMPFAPVTLFEFKDACYLNINGTSCAARFMTVALDCTEEMKRRSPASIHIDGTARPQLLKETDNPAYHRVLKEYYDLTGIPSLINTSFNIHNEPIVCSPEDAVRTFRITQLDYLAIGDFLAKIG